LSWLSTLPLLSPPPPLQQGKLRGVERLMELHLRAAACHLQYGITQYYLPPDTSEHTPLSTQPEAGAQFNNPTGMEG